MTLRHQIREAIDDVAPPAPTLDRRVRSFVLGDDDARRQLRTRHRSPWPMGVRIPAALVAAALVVVLIGGIVMGGRFWRNLNAPPSSVGPNALKTLESRPLNFPTLAPGAACPTTSPHLNQQIGMVLGDGPVYVGNGDIFEANDWGLWVAIGFAADYDPGLTLVRARDLKGSAGVAFAKYPLAPTPMTVAGSVLGTTHVVNHDVQMRSEAVVPDRSAWPPYPKLGQHIEVVVLLGMQKGSSGCIGFQVDAAGFSENFVIQPSVPGA